MSQELQGTGYAQNAYENARGKVEIITRRKVADAD